MRYILGILIILCGIAYSLLPGWYPDVLWLNGTLFSVIWPVSVSVIGLSLILAGRLLNPRDPVLVGWLAFSLAGCLFLIPLLIAKSTQEELDSLAGRELSGLHQQVQDALRRDKQAAVNEIKAARASRPKDRFTQYEGRVDALSLERIRALDDEMQAALKAKSEDYKLALEQNLTRGIDAWLTVRTREELEVERNAHQSLYVAARGFTQFVESFEESYTAKINALNLKSPADRVAIAEMERILQFAEANKAYELRKLDVELVGASLAALNVLYEDWGKWSFDRRTQDLSFEDAASEAAFQRALQRLDLARKAFDALESNLPDQN